MTQDKPNRARAVRKADYEALAAFRHELRVFLSFSEAAARAAGLTVIGVPSLAGIELVEAHQIAASLLDPVVVELTLI